MSAEDHPSTPPKKWSRMPSTVRFNLMHRIDAHLRTHGNRNYDLLREDPEFAPYIGGDAGEKRLDRLIKKMRATAPSLCAATGSARESNEGQGTAESREPQCLPAVTVIPISPAQVLSGGAVAVVGYHEVLHLYEEALPDIDRALRDCRNAQGELTDGDLLVKLRRERRATVDSISRLADGFYAGLSKSAFVQRLIERVLQETPDDPDRASVFNADINDIVREFAGLPATTKELK